MVGLQDHLLWIMGEQAMLKDNFSESAVGPGTITNGGPGTITSEGPTCAIQGPGGGYLPGGGGKGNVPGLSPTDI